MAAAFLPVVASLLLVELNAVLTNLGRTAADLTGEVAAAYRTIRVLGNGFILSALLWGSGVAMIIDRRLLAAAGAFGCAAGATLFGLIHSPLESGGLFWPWAVATRAPWALAGGYGLLAGFLALLAVGEGRKGDSVAE